MTAVTTAPSGGLAGRRGVPAWIWYLRPTTLFSKIDPATAYSRKLPEPSELLISVDQIVCPRFLSIKPAAQGCLLC